MPSPPPPPYPGGQDQYKAQAEVSMGQTAGEKQAAVNLKAITSPARDDAHAADAACVALYAQVQVWCQAHQSFIPPDVQADYDRKRTAAVQSLSQGDTNWSIGGSNFDDGERNYLKAQEEYGKGNYQYALYYSNWSWNSFQASKNAYGSAYSAYPAAKVKEDEAYAALNGWFQSVQ